MLVTAYALASKYAQADPRAVDASSLLVQRFASMSRVSGRRRPHSLWPRVENGGQVSHATLHARWSLKLYFASSRPHASPKSSSGGDLDVCAALLIARSTSLVLACRTLGFPPMFNTCVTCYRPDPMCDANPKTGHAHESRLHKVESHAGWRRGWMFRP